LPPLEEEKEKKKKPPWYLYNDNTVSICFDTCIRIGSFSHLQSAYGRASHSSPKITAFVALPLHFQIDLFNYIQLRIVRILTAFRTRCLYIPLNVQNSSIAEHKQGVRKAVRILRTLRCTIIK
jgi:hypothetical protein